MDDPRELGSPFDPLRIQALLAEQGRRVEWLAAQTDYERETVSRFINGRQPISAKFAVRAARAFGVPVEWLRADEVAVA